MQMLPGNMHTLRPLRSAIAGFMVVWLSGVAFLFCCQGAGAATVEAEHCPMAKVSPHCDKMGTEPPASEFVERSREDCVDCCGFLPAVFDKTRKAERTQKVAVPADETVVKRRLPAYTPDRSPTLQNVYARLPNLQKSFIRNCVFRI